MASSVWNGLLNGPKYLKFSDIKRKYPSDFRDLNLLAIRVKPAVLPAFLKSSFHVQKPYFVKYHILSAVAPLDFIMHRVLIFVLRTIISPF